MVRSRIAPTPSGLLHRGNAYNFLLSKHLAGQPGKIQLRIDDLDAPRVRPEYLQDIFDTLDWLNIIPDSGPRNINEQQEIYSQQLRIPRYNNTLDQLVKSGNIFACTCSRKEILERSIDSQYPGTCRHKQLPLDTPDASWRLEIPKKTIVCFEDLLLGEVKLDLYDAARDFVVRRRDGIPAYHIASLTDDEDSGINTIVRGKDLLESTAIQLHLAKLLGLPSFQTTRFFHHPLIETTEGEKLSKSAGSTSIRSIRESGMTYDQFHQQFLDWKKGFSPGHNYKESMD